MKKWKIEYFTNSSGNSPVRDFVSNMPPQAKAKTINAFRLIEEYGLDVGIPDIKHLEAALWEIRIKAFEGSYRFIFTVVKGRVIILVHAFQKKSQKTPLREIRIARARARG
jgi:phage-related protein